MLLGKGKFSAVFLAVLLTGGYAFYFYSYKSNTLYTCVPIIAMVIGYFGLAVTWFNFNGYTQRVLSIIVWSVYSAVGLILFGTLLIYTEEFQDSMLKQNGVSVKGVVVAENQYSRKSSTYKSITVGYTYNKKKYRQDFSNNIDMYKVKDTIIIICSSIDPEMAKVAVVNGDK